jgi:hypothetical protein
VYLGYTRDSGVGWGVRDTITDFRPGVDRIDLKGYTVGETGITGLRIEPLGDGLLLRFDVHHFSGNTVPQEIELGLAASAVFRFFHKVQGTHFYTASAAERDGVIANYSATYAYEGTGFFTAEAEAGAAPVFRFFHRQSGTHFLHRLGRRARLRRGPLRRGLHLRGRGVLRRGRPARGVGAGVSLLPHGTG